MPKTIEINITESVSELKYLLRKQDKILQQSRVRSLLLIKEGKVRYTYEIAKKLKRERKTIYNWLELYKKEGIVGYLRVKSRGSRNERLSASTKESLRKKLQDPSSNITSYVELLHWAEENCQKNIPYHSLYHYCHDILKGRLKVARKSHHKKDEQAVEVFKKTP